MTKGDFTMATKLPGEKYLGTALHLPLSQDGQIAAYVWPLRILRDIKVGGPTIGVEVGNEEVLRYDCHAKPGHWHRGGYDRLEVASASEAPFPEGITGVAEQIAWSLQQIQENSEELFGAAEHSSAAKELDPSLVQTAITAIKAHLDKEGDLRSKAISDDLINS
jgi:hypothetical protein